MGKGKLILICQSGGKFEKDEDGSLTYTEGEAEALDINGETKFDDLKIKLAEIWNLEQTSMSIKYFLPGNKRTLITLSNDKDLKRMYDFHEDTVTAHAYVTGKKGFDRNACGVKNDRICGLKVAESVIATVATESPTLVSVPIGTVASTVDFTSKVTPSTASPISLPLSFSTDSLISVNVTYESPTRMDIISKRSLDDPIGCIPTPGDGAAKSNAHSPIILDMSATPADTVKKRRRTPYWQNGPNGPTIVSLVDNAAGETGKSKSRKKNDQSHNPTTSLDVVEQQLRAGSSKDDSSCALDLVNSGDGSVETLVASWKNGITGVGQEFKGVSEFRDALQKYAIAHRFAYRFKKNDTNRASAICVTEGCSWRLHASWVPSAQVFMVKKLNDSHTCEGESWKAAHPSKNWLVNIIKERLRDSPHHKPKDIANGILRDFGIELNYTQVWRGIGDAREQLQGSYKKAYTHLPWFCDKIGEANPGSFVKLFIDDNKKFQQLFLSFHASILGFQVSCRPLLFLDFTSLKSKYHEILLTATALDGDDNFYPVAFAIVDVENEANWRWFLEHLRLALSTSRSITFVFDREKGLMKSVLEVFENAHHGYSIYYLLKNLKKNCKGPFHGDGKSRLIASFLAAAHEVRVDGFRMFTEQIKLVSSKAYEWVMQIEPQYWTNAVFKGEPYSDIISNVAELYSKWIQEVWELPIIQKLETLGSKMMELINNRREDSSSWSSKLTPSKERKLVDESQRARGLTVFFSTDILFEVHGDSVNVVDIEKWECSCLGWKPTGLPCRHAIAVLNYTHRNVYDYCPNYFTVESYRASYAESINPVSSLLKPLDKEKSDKEVEIVLPPSISRPPSQEDKKQNNGKDWISGQVVSDTAIEGAEGKGDNTEE